MADLTSTSTITYGKTKKGVTQFDTVGEVGTLTYKVTIPNPANATDLIVLGKIPAGVALNGVYLKANAAIASNTGLEFGITANANGAGTVVAIANSATGISNTLWTYVPAATGAVAGAVGTGDNYLVATVRGNSTAAVHTVTATFVTVGIDVESAPYSTFTL